MNNDNRGFDKIIGKRVVSVDTDAVNVAHIHFEDGTVVSVNAESLSCFGIPVITCDEYWGDDQ